MEYEGCYTAWSGMYDITGGHRTDYLWADGTPVGPNDFQGWSHFMRRNDPNSFTADEPSIGYVELMIGDPFPQCGIFFWGDECGGDTARHPCGVCYKYYTASPTKSPTEVPTTVPTISPTKNPTISPSVSPSVTPTEFPTGLPTTTPTVSPTVTPSVSPTKSPTTTPTTSPTKAPTLSPSISPSISPTTTPTVEPTVPPSVSPTTSPTKNPTTFPTDSPTVTPTVEPTVTPSVSPTISPSVTPTEFPTGLPTTTPTVSPTVTPSVSPTKSPTTTPTTSPTKAPTLSPSISPSISPTTTPTVEPTVPPSVSPTTSPTKNPTAFPTESPTVTPTVEPTVTPSVSPTISPSKSPTKTPTVSPTTTPSISPTLSPTVTPTKTPSVSPTFTPTTSPTIDTKCGTDSYIPRIFDETDTNGLGLYSTSIEDNYVIFQYKGNGDSFIRVCFSKDCQITGATTYSNPFFEITLDEVGNSGTYTLKYIDIDGSVTVLDAETAIDLTSSTAVDFYVAFDLFTEGIVFGNSYQVGENILLSNDLTECCENYPTNTQNKRYSKPFRNIYYGSLGLLPSNSVEIKFCTEPIDLCPDFEMDYDNMIAYYRADNFINDFDTANEIEKHGYIKDISYYGNNIESSQITNILNIIKRIETVPGGSISVITGDDSVSIDVDSPLNSHSMLPSLYTLFTVARRDPTSPNAGNEGAIFESKDDNFTSGFGPSGEIGQAQRGETIISEGSATELKVIEQITFSHITIPPTSFIMSGDKRSSYRVQGIDTTTALPTLKKPYTNFGINTNPSNGPASSFEISEIIIFKTELTVDEICCIEYYLAERNKIRSENGEFESLFTSETYPPCCIEVDEYPVYNPTNTDINTQQTNIAQTSFLKELKKELLSINIYGERSLYVIILQIGIILNILLLIFICILVYFGKKDKLKRKNKKIISYYDISKWNKNKKYFESEQIMY